MNEISGLSFQGEWTEDVNVVKSGVRDHFQNQFSGQRGHRPVMRPELFSKKVSEDDNSMLIEPFTEIEVLEAINSCESSRSPGPDGFNFKFIKTCWEVIKGDILKMLDEFHRNGKLVRGLNSSFIVLLQKKRRRRDS